MATTPTAFSFNILPADLLPELLQYLCLSPSRDVLRLRQTNKENLKLFNLEEILSTLLKLDELIANDYDLSRVPKRKIGFRQSFETIFSYEYLYNRTVTSLIQAIAMDKAKTDSFVHIERWVKRLLLTKATKIEMSNAPEIYYNAFKTALLHKNKLFLDQVKSSADVTELVDLIHNNQHLMVGLCLKSNDAEFINSFITSPLFNNTKHSPMTYFCWMQQLIQQKSPKQLLKQFMTDFNDQLLKCQRPLVEAVSVKWDHEAMQMILEHFSARNEKELLTKSAKIFLSILCEEEPVEIIQQIWSEPLSQFPLVDIQDTINRAISLKGVELLQRTNSLKRVFASPAVQSKILLDVLTAAATKDVALLEVAKVLVQEGFEFDRKWTDQVLLRKKSFKNKLQVMQFLLTHALVNVSEILLNTVEVSFTNPDLDDVVLFLVNSVPKSNWNDILGNGSNNTIFHVIGQVTRALYTWKIIFCVPYHTITLMQTLLAQGHDIKAVNSEGKNLEFYINDSFFTNIREREAVLQLC